MKQLRLVYLLCFLAPVAFLLGYIAGAPPEAPRASANSIDTRHLSISNLDLARQETSLVVDGVDWLQPNVSFDSRRRLAPKPNDGPR